MRSPARMRTLGWMLCGSVAMASLVAAPSARAADEPSAQDIAQARQLGGQAQAAYEAGNYAESEKLWAAASKLYPVAPTLMLGLARAQVKAGKFLSAQESYNKIIREWSNRASPPPAFKAALDAATSEVGSLASRVASVTIKVDGGPENPHVTVDGAPVPAVALGLKRPIDPGQHTIKAVADGYKSAESTLTVGEGGSAEAVLKLEKDASAHVVAAAPPPGNGASNEPAKRAAEAPAPHDTAEGSKKSMNKTLALAAWGVGGAGLVLGGITGALAMGKHSTLASACPGGKCASDQKDTVSSYTTLGTLSTVGFVVAGVGAAAGAVLWFTAPKETGRTPTTTGFVMLDIGPGSAGVHGQF